MALQIKEARNVLRVSAESILNLSFKPL
ncbi:hypothetical protein CHELA1G11_12518 [Hyphomicrobiales bacterium]|nr:hypothetical protein CHELA1G11_12518 [Hyphomicrobiales bacterium]